MLKTISIVLTEKMIQQIDDALLHRDFSSRSEFFRVLILMWSKDLEEDIDEKPGEIVDEVDYEFGIPPGEIEKIKEKAKLLN